MQCKAWFLSVFRAAGEKKVKNLFQSNLELLLFLFSPFNIRPFNPSGSQIQTGNQLDYSHCRHECLCSTFAIFQYCFYAVFFFAPIYIIGLSAIGGINSIYILQRKTAWLGKWIHCYFKNLFSMSSRRVHVIHSLLFVIGK